MQILLVAATEMEIAPFIKSNPLADMLITGVGMHATIYHLTKRIHQFDHDMIIQAGIAGAITEKILPAKVFAIRTDRFADIGIAEQGHFTSLFESKLAPANGFPFKSGGLHNNNTYLGHCGIEVCDALTVNLVSDNTRHAKTEAGKYHASLESMEGAAFHYVCLQEEVPFLQLRSVSNEVGERDKSKWYLQQAIENLCTELQRIYLELLDTHHSQL